MVAVAAHSVEGELRRADRLMIFGHFQITFDEAKTMRMLKREEGMSAEELADAFCVHVHSVYHVLNSTSVTMERVHGRGESANCVTKLTTAAVRAIRACHPRGEVAVNAVARYYGVAPSTIAAVLCRHTWKHI